MSDKHQPTDTMAWPAFLQPVKKLTSYGTSRSSKLLIVFAVVVVGVVLGSWWSLPALYSSPITSVAPLITNVRPTQVVVRTIPTNNSGLGSVVAQLRSSAVIATMLGASFTTFSVISGHMTQYRATSILGLDRLGTSLDANTTVCSLAMSPDYDRILELMEDWCDSTALADEHALELQEILSDCGLILDDRPWDARYDMSKCTWKWVRDVFSALGLKKRPGGIGLHIRWGDLGSYQFWDVPEELKAVRSTPVSKGAELLRKLRECGMQDELSVYMELHNDTMLSGLGEPYRIVDSGDSVADLIDLASNRLLILDISSWTVIAHQIAEGGITVVPDIDLFNINWYDNGVNHILRWQELLSIPCSNLSALFAS